MMQKSSDSESPLRNGLMVSGASVCPMKMLAATLSDSAPLTPITFCMAIAMQKVMGVSGAESLNVAASIFMGQTEAPLTIKPFLNGLSESELFCIMTSGMAHVSGSVMAAYVMVAHVTITHLLTAVIMT